MPITIIQQPQSLTLVGCIPDIIVETTGLGMVVNLKVGATVLLSEYYTADQVGRARVNLRDFIDEQLEVDIPTSDLFEQTKSWKTFTVEITVGTDVTSFNFTALKGGSSKLTLDCPAFIKEAWLTWQVQTKQVHDVDPEWLSYFAQYDADVKVKAWFTGGISETITLHELLAGKHYSMNMTFSDIRELFVVQPIYFDVWVENKPAAPVEFTTWQMRYVLTLETFDYDNLFVFKNGLGGIDTIRFTGESRSVNPMEVGAALFYDEYEIDYLVTPRLAVEKNTGFFRSKEAMLWAQDFFLNKQRYIYQEEALVPIRLISPETITQDLVLVSYDFTYGYTRQTNYLALFKKKSPLIDPIIIGPGDSEFYLPPVISEFPQQTDPEGLLFPVQKPGVPGWFFITWENMLSEILGVLPEVPPVPSHNELLGLQGGSPAIGEAPAERYHLTAEEHATAQGITRSVDGLGNPIQYQFPTTVKGQSAIEQNEFVTLSQMPTTPAEIGANADLGAGINAGLNASLVDSPGTLNKYVTLNLLNSYAYVQEAPINGSPHYRKDGAWVAFTPFAAAGTVNYLQKITSAGVIGDSQVFDNGTSVGIGTASPSAYYKLDVIGSISSTISTSGDNYLNVANSGSGNVAGISLNNAVDTYYYPAYYKSINAFIFQYYGPVAGGGSNTNYPIMFSGSTGNVAIQTFAGITSAQAIPSTVRLYVKSYTSTIDPFVVDSGAVSNILFVKYDGKIGFQTNVPTETIDINGTTRIRALSGTNGYITLASATGVIGQSQIFDNGTNVGFGTILPTERITIASGHIKSLSPGFYILSSTGQIIAGVDDYGTYINAGSNASTPANMFIGRMNTGTIFQTSGGLERMRIHTNGFLGLGKNNPTTLLDANGSVQFNHDGVSGNVGVTYFDKYLDHARLIQYNHQGTPTTVFQTNGNNWINGGFLGVNTDTPTERADINGGLRIRNIANLGYVATNVMVPSATGVQSLRTVTEFRGDIGAQATIAGTLTESYIATIVAGVPTWAAAPSSSKWTDVGSDIYRNSRVLIGAASFTDSYAKNEINGGLRVNELLYQAPTLTTISTVTTESVNMTSGTNMKRYLLQANLTINFSADLSSASTSTYTFVFKQNATGGRTVAWNVLGTDVIWQGGVEPIISDGANEITVITIIWTGEEYLGVKSCGFNV